jgi:hypothetical protein
LRYPFRTFFSYAERAESPILKEWCNCFVNTARKRYIYL